MCEFCETKEQHLLDKGIYIDMVMGWDEYGYYIRACESDDVYYRPKYCPECGRKLKEE